MVCEGRPEHKEVHLTRPFCVGAGHGRVSSSQESFSWRRLRAQGILQRQLRQPLRHTLRHVQPARHLARAVCGHAKGAVRDWRG